jgi:hypothetical protein
VCGFLEGKTGDDVAEEVIGKETEAVAEERVWGHGEVNGGVLGRHSVNSELLLYRQRRGRVGDDRLVVALLRDTGRLLAREVGDARGHEGDVGVEHRGGLVDDVGQRDGDVGGEAVLVADLGRAEDVDGGEVRVELLRFVGRLLEQPTPVVGDHHGIEPSSRDLLGNVGVGLDGGDPLRPCGSGLGVAPLPSSLALVELPVELGEQLVDFIEKELGRRRDLSRRIHDEGTENRLSPIPIVSNPTGFTNR